MKVWIGFAIFLWLLCGFAAGLWLGDMRAKTLAKGPISLARAYNENPPSYPGP